jgi:outer membrane lipoprotein-sorting protein
MGIISGLRFDNGLRGWLTAVEQGSLHGHMANVALGILLLASSLLCTARAAEFDLTQIMERNFVVGKVVDSISYATFTLINKAGQERVRKTFGTSKLQVNGIDNMRMTHFLSPPDVKGTVSLLVEHSEKDDDMWIYLPALKKVRRLVSSDKKTSFVGTDFSYADVIGFKVKEWNYKLLNEETVDGQRCYVIEATPTSEQVKDNTGYSKRVLWLRKDILFTVKADFYDESGAMLKTETFTDIREADPKRNKWQAMHLQASNVQTGRRTIIQFENFKVDQNVKDDYFTTKYMERE